ncbi:MAG: hypothetical protein V2I82_04715 [Halieaceae bacterium]|jgi:hypothetical protein|nr:hypothetical protein [Halieaceae bacterium]
MAEIPLPGPDDLRRMLAMMYGRLEVKEGTPVKIEDGKCVTAIFLSDDNVPLGAALADYPFAAFTGAAMTRIPPGGAEDCADSGELSEPIFDNVHEVFNICSRLLMDADTPHLRLGPLYAKASEVPESEVASITAASRSVTMNVDVPNYGAGNVSFLVF